MTAFHQTIRFTWIPFATIAAILSSRHPTNAFSSEPLRQGQISGVPATPPLATWLEQNNAIIQSRIGLDFNGVRGLLLDDNTQSQHICQIPRSCIITASSQSKRQNNASRNPIDALAATLLQEIKLGSKSEYFPYICNLPSCNDISLASMGGSWTEEQLAWLGHEPTMQYFANLGSERKRFVESNNNEGSAVLAGWAYDLVSSRALQGPFGRGGTVRFALLSTIMSFAFAATAPFLFDNLSIETLLETAKPLVLSTSLLTLTLLRKEPELAMLPWIDIANHKSKSLLHLEYGLFGDTIILKQDGVAANEASSEQQQQQLGSVNFDYGGASQGAVNNKLLGVYGFVEEDNPNDTLDVRVGEDTVTIGRHGVLCTSLSESGCTLNEITRTVRELRSNLVELDEMHDYTKMDDTIESQRCWLAAQWRKEKTRLIEEFLLENCA